MSMRRATENLVICLNANVLFHNLHPFDSQNRRIVSEVSHWSVASCSYPSPHVFSLRGLACGLELRLQLGPQQESREATLLDAPTMYLTQQRTPVTGVGTSSCRERTVKNRRNLMGQVPLSPGMLDHGNDCEDHRGSPGLQNRIHVIPSSPQRYRTPKRF